MFGRTRTPTYHEQNQESYTGIYLEGISNILFVFLTTSYLIISYPI